MQRCIPFSWRLGPNFTESVKLLARDKYDLYKDFHEQVERSKQQAASSKQQAASSKQQASSAECPYPITITIGYGWSEHAGEGGLNKHWDFLRDMAGKAVKDISKRAAKRSGAQHPLKVSINRLRGRHGTTLFGGILQKIDRSDILFFDISGSNPNVHFELGYAIGTKGADSGRVFIFGDESKLSCTENEKSGPCSDIAGYMLTLYRASSKSDKSKGAKKDQSTFKLNDPRGFSAALISSLTEVARERGMWGSARTTFETENDAES